MMALPSKVRCAMPTAKLSSLPPEVSTKRRVPAVPGLRGQLAAALGHAGPEHLGVEQVGQVAAELPAVFGARGLGVGLIRGADDFRIECRVELRGRCLQHKHRTVGAAEVLTVGVPHDAGAGVG